MQADIKISPRHIKLKELFPAAEPMKASLGEINGSAALRSPLYVKGTFKYPDNGCVHLLSKIKQKAVTRR